MNRARALITISSDFGVQSQGIGIMEATVLDISPDANVVHLMHGLPDFDIVTAARTMETVECISSGYHVCVVDPGVGTERKGIIIKTKRGDCLIGPDNGVLIPAARILGGCEKAVEITNPKYMRQPVSPIFHGRDVFCPAAAYLSLGVPVEEFGREIEFGKLVKAPYEEAGITGNCIEAQVIHVNKFGSLHLNILPSLWDEFSVRKRDIVTLDFRGKKVDAPYVETFGDVAQNKPLILKDDYTRVEISINMGSFAKAYGIKVGDKCIVRKKSK